VRSRKDDAGAGVKVGVDVEEDGSLGQKVRGSTWLCIDVCSESLGEDMNRCENLVTIGFANILWYRRFVEFLLKLGAVRILKAGAQSFSSGVHGKKVGKTRS
jgi:hypothetical protein